MSNVFVTGVGRCGTVSFFYACKHITNYTSSHESVIPWLTYPSDHIEVNPHFKCCLHEIIDKYPDSCWVHLIRNEADSVESLRNLDNGDVVRRFHHMHGSVVPEDETQAAKCMWRYYNQDIHFTLRNRVRPDRFLVMNLEQIKDQWSEFWNMIGAEGDFDASVASWNTKRNTTEERQARA